MAEVAAPTMWTIIANGSPKRGWFDGERRSMSMRMMFARFVMMSAFPRARRSQPLTVVGGRPSCWAIGRWPCPCAAAVRAAQTVSTLSVRRGNARTGTNTWDRLHARQRPRRGVTRSVPPPRSRTGRVRADPQEPRCPEQSVPGAGVVAAGDAFGGCFGVKDEQQRRAFLESGRRVGGWAGRVRVAAFTAIDVQCQVGRSTIHRPPPSGDTTVRMARPHPTCLKPRPSSSSGTALNTVVQIGSAFWLRTPIGKLHNDHYIPLHPNIKELLDDRLAQLPNTLRSDLMFCDRGRPIPGTRVDRAVQRAATAAGVGHVHPHRLRHTIATQAINCGMSLEAIAALLGHKSLSMTMVHAQIADRTVADEYFAVTEKLEALYDLNRPGFLGGS